MIKAITFDLDDTLWPVAPTIQTAEKQSYSWLSQTAAKFSETFTAQSFLEYRIDYAKENPQLKHLISDMRIASTSAALQQSGYSRSKSMFIAIQSAAIFMRYRNQVTPFQGAVTLLNTLKKNYLLGTLSNGNANITKTEFSKIFDFSFSAEQLNSSKPEPALFLAGISAAKCKASELVHVGDSISHDILGAKSLGINTIWLNLDEKVCPPEGDPTVEINNLSDLPKALSLIE